MKPAPRTPIFLSCVGGTFLGRRAPLFNSCMETNSERIIAFASLDSTILVKWRLSILSAVSNGSCRPSNTVCRIALAAG